VASKSAILSILDQIGAMEARLSGTSIVPFIRFPSDLDEDAVIERHFKLFPRERDAELVVTTKIRVVASIAALSGYDGKSDKAWRQIVAERADDR
jgi:hypothetical protein